MLFQALKAARRKPGEEGNSFAEILVAVLILPIVVVFMGLLTSQVLSYDKAISMKNNLETLSSEVDKSLITQDKDKLIVENGGKFPKIELTVDDKQSSGTLLINGNRSSFEIDTPSNVYYDIATDFDGYFIRAYKFNPQDKSKELIMQYDSNTKVVEKIEK